MQKLHCENNFILNGVKNFTKIKKGKYEMKYGKKLTRKQKIFLKGKNLNTENWLVRKETPAEMMVQHRHTGTVRRISKENEC